jgi:uncharacterized protein (DUF1501 family)
MKHIEERREFLKTATAMAIAGGLPTLDALTRVAHAAGGIGVTEVPNDYKAIVCVFLYGGQDHSNVLVPYADGNAAGTDTAATFSEYTIHANARSGGSTTQGSGPNLSYARSAFSGTTLGATTASTHATSGFTTNTYGRQFALHPSYSEIRYLYTQNKAAVMANTGPLTGKVNRDDWFTDRYANGLPANLYSHDDQQKAWMSGRPDVLNPQVGAGGRIAKSVVALNGANPQVSISISVSGTSPFQLSDTDNTVAYQVGAGYVGRKDNNTQGAFCNTDQNYIDTSTQPYCLEGGPIRLNSGISWNDTMNNAMRARFASVPNLGNIYSNQWATIMRQSISTEQAISAALVQNPLNEDTVLPFEKYRPSSQGGSFAGSGPTINIVDPAAGTPVGGYNSLAAQLRMVATLIRASTALGGVKRQIYFVAIGGFDTHGSEFWGVNPAQNKRIDRALDAFWQALGRVQVTGAPGETAQSRVTLFTMSDFGRTLDSNGQGSDHGWGSHHIVLGGAVKGGFIYGGNHSVSTADIPNDRDATPLQKSRFMMVDPTAGAVPRYGIPPLWYDNTQGSDAPGGKARTPIPGAAGQFLPLNHALDRGELLPTMSSDAYVATIARWFGVPANELTGIFPKLTGTNGAHPSFDITNGVGFMTIT